MTNYLPAWPWIFQEFSKFLLAYGDVAVLPLRLFERCITPGFLSLALRVPAVIVVGVGLTIAEFIQEAVHVIQIVVPACILVPVWPLFVPWLTRHTFRRVVQFAAVFLTVTNLASEAFAWFTFGFVAVVHGTNLSQVQVRQSFSLSYLDSSFPTWFPDT